MSPKSTLAKIENRGTRRNPATRIAGLHRLKSRKPETLGDVSYTSLGLELWQHCFPRLWQLWTRGRGTTGLEAMAPLFSRTTAAMKPGLQQH